VRMAKAIKSA